MGGLIILSALALAFVGAAAIPFILIGALFWLITFPLRLLFKLIGGILGMVFGLLGGLLGLIIGPIVMVVVVVALIGALLAALLSLLAPLLPVALLGLLVWAVYRVTKRPNPAF
jgi:hypothetical protein